MRIHHLNCMTMCPLGGMLMDGHAHLFLSSAKLVCHCLLIESDRHGLVLVDTGFGTRDARERERLSPLFRRLNRPTLDEGETALRQVERLGFRARDVRHIILTHLDFDHAGGLDDFPEARVHLLARERDVATAQRSWLDRQRFRPQQWSSQTRWVTYQPSGEAWHGFDSVRAAVELDEEILLVPLPGHTMGHAGVALKNDGRWLLHCGDAYFYAGEMDLRRAYCTPGLAAYQTMMEQDRGLRLLNQRRLRQLAAEQADSVQLFCAHDPHEFERLRRAAEPLRVSGPDGGHASATVQVSSAER
jgi:glyoxylase-like metal-dependent hydrolase (beta-lactamase superfamily II)